MKVKCETCQKEVEIPDRQVDAEGSFFCSQLCEDMAKQNLLRAIFGEPEVVKNMKVNIPVPTVEELEFLEDEISLIVKNHRMEDSADAMEKLFEFTQQMIDRGIVDESPEGVQRAWDMIFEQRPELKEHFKKFTSVLFDEVVKEKEHGERQH